MAHHIRLFRVADRWYYQAADNNLNDTRGESYGSRASATRGAIRRLQGFGEAPMDIVVIGGCRRAARKLGAEVS